MERYLDFVDAFLMANVIFYTPANNLKILLSAPYTHSAQDTWRIIKAENSIHQQQRKESVFLLRMTPALQMTINT